MDFTNFTATENPTGVMASFSDKERLEGLRRGERQAVQSLYDDYFDRIAHYIVQNSGSKTHAQDIFQDAVVVLFQKVRSPEFQLTSSIYTFLFSVCRNLWLKKLRKSGKEEVTSDQDMEYIDEGPEKDEWEEQARYQMYRRKLRQLGEGCQNLLQLSMQGLSMKQIVARLGISSEQYARKKKFKCKEQLVRLIKADPDYEALRYDA